MVCIRINVVHSNSIDAQLPHQGHIPAALFGVDQRVFGNELVSNPWKNIWSTALLRRINGLEECIPLMKNCLPSLVKNLDPTADKGEMANTWVSCRHVNSTKHKATAGNFERVIIVTKLMQK